VKNDGIFLTTWTLFRERSKGKKGSMNKFVKEQNGVSDQLIKNFAYLLQNEGIAPP